MAIKSSFIDDGIIDAVASSDYRAARAANNATAAGSISDRRAVSVSPKNGIALAVLPLARAVLLIRDIAPINEYRLGQRLDPCDLSADGRAGLGFTPFFRQPWRTDSKRRRSETLPATPWSRAARGR